ncbi:sensor histidine kinase [Clostridium aestuarii]|uniref:histidine kinase n=1 Tax=Clostridium aestuarii TaxID=338193 RepID=A0ABT4CZ26_9CLOT|nr:sensor histidine kinase [Clostridium aestuarii]MCY6484231.1 sensor histidine kinase [Clostridium aestuarii]
MDTNLKNNIKDDKNKIMSSAFMTVLMIFIFSVISVGSYAPIKNLVINTEKSTKAYIESDNFIFTLRGLTDYLKKSKIQEDSWDNTGYEDLKSIKYYITNKDKTIKVTNIPDDEESKLQEIINKSRFYAHIQTDEKGNAKVDSLSKYKFNKSEFIRRLEISDEYKADYANLDITYIIPMDLSPYNDMFTYKIKDFNITSCCVLILVIGALSLLILTIIAFSIPYSVQSKISICRLFNKMFLELKGITWIAAISVLFTVLNELSYRVYSEFNIINIICDANMYFYIIGILTTFVLYLLVYLSIIYIKYIYHTGFKKGFIQNSALFRICSCIFRKIKTIFKKILSIDVTKDVYKEMVKILGINLIILWVVALFGAFGVILAIVYTIFLFKYLLKIIVNVKELNDISMKLADGDVDITINENMGIFSPICKNLNNIKDGFKVAVDKAVKSQKMKTDLISNVSHDLKTPLTSIITYIDLLKKQDITNETKKEYIDIIDRKSKRLSELIKDLFEASKASSGNIEFNLEKIDVIALFRQTLGELEEKINESTLQMKMKLPENKIICELDGKKTYRIFENIMCNILKYSMPNSRVYIDILENEKEVSFTFKNISNYEMNFDAEEITERFTRGDKSRNTEGSGLGLAIAKSFIELQNGELIINIDGDLFKLIVKFQKTEKE